MWRLNAASASGCRQRQNHLPSTPSLTKGLRDHPNSMLTKQWNSQLNFQEITWMVIQRSRWRTIRFTTAVWRLVKWGVGIETAHPCVVKPVIALLFLFLPPLIHIRTPSPSCLSSGHHLSPVRIRLAVLSSFHDSLAYLFCLSELRWHWHHSVCFTNRLPLLSGIKPRPLTPLKAWGVKE